MKHLKHAPAGRIALESSDYQGIALEGIALEGITDSLKGMYTKLKQVLFGDPTYQEALVEVKKALDTNIGLMQKLKSDLSKNKFEAFDAKVGAKYMAQLGLSGRNVREILQSIKARQGAFERAVKLAYDAATKAVGKDLKSKEVQDADAAFKAMLKSIKGQSGEVPADLKLTREDVLNVIQAMIDLLVSQKNVLNKYDFSKFKSKIAMEEWRGIMTGSDEDIVDFVIGVCKFVLIATLWLMMLIDPVTTILGLLFWVAVYKIIAWAFDSVFGSD